LTTAQTGTPTSGANLAAPIITSRSVYVTLATPLSDGQSIDFRWTTLGNTVGGANAHIGIDNASVTAIAEPTSSLLGILAFSFVVSCIAFGRRRSAFLHACAVRRNNT